MNAFASLALGDALRVGLDALGFAEATPVQRQSLPAILAGRDLIARAPTGSGKTVAFGLGVLARVKPAEVGVQGLVLCPTRELAEQVGGQLRRLAVGIANLKLSVLTGGVPIGPQLASLSHPPQVVVGTLGRVQDLLRRGALSLGEVRTLVLDEADRMLDMGFEDVMREIVAKTPGQRQTLLFSATWPDAMDGIGRSMLRDPLQVAVDEAAAPPATIEQLFFDVAAADRTDALATVLLMRRPQSCVVFCNTRRDAAAVAEALGRLGFAALALHGELAQQERDEVLVRFANRSCNVLVASDVAARGLDIDHVDAVINHELPTDPDVYMHRIGRTGRAGRTGVALSLCTPREQPRAGAIAQHLGVPLRWVPVPRPDPAAAPVAPPAMVTLRIDGGRRDKLRRGDVLGALTGDAGIPAEAVGLIDVLATRTYVAVDRHRVARALSRLQAGRIKARRFRVHRV